MLIAQISDTHMLPPGEIAYGVADTEAALRRAAQAVNKAKPDVVIHTGDFAHHGAPEAYALALDILQDLEAPLYAIPGNHDDRANMRAAFWDFDWMPEKDTPEAFIHYVFDVGPLSVIALDSVIPGEGGGTLCEARLAWLGDALEAAQGRPTIVALHHPPFPPGLDGFSKFGLANADRLAAAIQAAPHVVRVICGHNHRTITGVCGGAPTVVAPSASYPFAFDRTVGAPLSISEEPPGVAMHLWRDDAGLLSHVTMLGDYGPPKPLLKDGKLLLPEATEAT